MKKLLSLFLAVIFAFQAHAETWTLPSGVDNVILEASEGIQVCSGTGDIVLATGCGASGGTTYKITFDATDGSFDVTDLVVTGQLLLPSGSVSEPGFAWSANPDTGIRYDTSSRPWRFVYDGADVAHISNGGQFAADIGSAASPSYGNDQSGGEGVFFKNGQDQVFIAANGVEFAAFDGDNNDIELKPGGTTVATFDSGGLKLGFVLINAAGANQATATAITTQLVRVDGSTGANGVRLPDVTAADLRFIRNNSASNLLIYPATGDNINLAGLNVPTTIAARTMAICLGIGTTDWFCHELAES